MTAVRPFHALRYDLKRVELSKVIVPPYDVVADDERSAFFDRDPHNAIRFELARDAKEDAGADYAHLSELLDQWRQEGVLIPRRGPRLLRHEATLSHRGGESAGTSRVLCGTRAGRIF